MDEVVNVDLKRRTSGHDQLKKIRESYTDLLKKKRDTMRKLAETVGSDDRQTLALRQQYAMEHLHYLQTRAPGRPVAEAEARGPAQGDANDREAGEPDDASPSPLRAGDRPARRSSTRPSSNVADQLAEQQQQLDIGVAKVRRLARNPAAEPSYRSPEQRRQGPPAVAGHAGARRSAPR